MAKRNVKRIYHDKRIAERLYDQELAEMIKMVGGTTTYLDQLQNAGKLLFGNRFLGVFTSDKVPKTIPKGSLLIANLDSSGESGSHWIGIAKGRKSNEILVYDSFGRRIHKIIPAIYGNGRKIKSTERDKEQEDEEQNCGARCLAFLRVFYILGPAYARWI